MLSLIKDSIMPACTRTTAAAAVTTTGEMRAYKLTDNQRTRKIGLGANSLQMLLNKAKQKFALQTPHIYLASDGFEICDEPYFQSLPAQTLFVVAESDAIVQTDADFEYERLRQQTPMVQLADAFYEFIEQQPASFRRMIADYERRKQREALDQSKSQLSLKSEHAEWFEGQDERYKCKEEAMSVRAQTRVRGYYYKAKEELTTSKLYRQHKAAHVVIDDILTKFRYLLIGCDYFSTIFNRKCARKHEYLARVHGTEEPDAVAVVPNKRLKQVIKEYTARNELLDEWTVSLCTEFGEFYCQGAYSGDGGCCPLKHNINPYASRENLILFQVWNLDHQIELSRTILPALLAHVEELVTQPERKCKLHKKRVVDVSVLEYFLEIFSLKNLKLVHIVCHEKVQRSNKSNGRLVCADCHEYKIVEELMSVDIPEAN